MGLGPNGPHPNSLKALKHNQIKKGEVRNKNGRPWGVRNRELEQQIKDTTKQGAECVEFLVRVMRDTKERTLTRILACQTLLNRGWGRAPLTIRTEASEASVQVARMQQMTTEQLSQLIVHLDEAKQLLEAVPVEVTDFVVVEGEQAEGEQGEESVDPTVPVRYR